MVVDRDGEFTYEIDCFTLILSGHNSVGQSESIHLVF